MSEVVISLSSDSDNREIDKYHDSNSDIGSSSNSGSRSNSSSSSTGGNTTDEQYMPRVPGFPLEILQEALRMRTASGLQVGTSMSVPSSTDLDEVETMYSCVVGVHSKTDEKRLICLRSWYQIPDDLNPRLVVCDEWCCNPHFGRGVYEAYLLGGLRLPLNVFARELLNKLGLGVCQFNPNAWRLAVSMQIL